MQRHPQSTRPRRTAPARSSAGFSLLEVLVALAILGVCLIFVAQVLVQESFVERRVSSQVAALRLLEAHSEIVRAGYRLPTRDGTYEMELLVLPPPDARLDDPELRLKLRKLTRRGLWRADLELDYRVAGVRRSQSLEMRLWRP